MGNEQTAGEIRINDGKGLYDSDGLIDTLIFDLNNLTKALVSGEFVQYSGLIFQMYQKMKRLKNGIVTDREKLEEQIEDLRNLNNELAEKAFGSAETKDGGKEDGSAVNPEEKEGVQL